jgi:hypothetical protein
MAKRVIEQLKELNPKLKEALADPILRAIILTREGVHPEEIVEFGALDEVGMTPGSTLLPEDLARDSVDKFHDRVDRANLAKRYTGKKKDLGELKRLDDRIEAREKRIKESGDPQDKRVRTGREYKRRTEEGIKGDKVKEMTNFERTLAIRKRLEEMLRDDGGKK